MYCLFIADTIQTLLNSNITHDLIFLSLVLLVKHWIPHLYHQATSSGSMAQYIYIYTILLKIPRTYKKNKISF